MSQLKITKVSVSDDLCWGLLLLDDDGNGLLRSLKGVNKFDAASIAETLKLEGAKAPVSEDGKEEVDRPTWIILKTDQGWAVRFSLVAVTAFDLFLKPEAVAEQPKEVVESVEKVKKCLRDVEIVWEPPEEEPVLGPITIKVDNESYEAPKNPMTANEILQLGGLDPDCNYLVQIKDGERIKYKDKGEQPIELFVGATFVGHYTGEKGVSQLAG
ncbi:MAG: hypothetical protein F4X93_01800 [Proteobacteria bacterium]|nr:hypothetical protein [Pseudomonadota bacterium]